MPTTSHALRAGILAAFLSTALFGQPSVVPTTEGQIGATPGTSDAVLGTSFESVRGQTGDIVFGGIFVFGGPAPPPPEAAFFTDRIHGTPNPMPLGAFTSPFANVDKLAPDSAWSRNAGDDGDFVAFSFAVDGSAPQTMDVRVATFDEQGNSGFTVTVPNIGTAPFPDPTFSKVGATVNQNGEVTVIYPSLGAAATIEGQRFDAAGNPIGGPVTIRSGAGYPDVALLDPAGDRLIVSSTDFATIAGNVLDLSGPTPVVGPTFTLNTTPATFAHVNPVVATNRVTGNGLVVWEDLTGVVGNPVDIRARRFDAAGNPIGNDFVVNTTTAESQGQADAAYDPSTNLNAIVWTGDGANLPTDGLDTYIQVYDPMGNPIGGEIRVNTTTPGFQDRPAVRFLPDRDNMGRPQVLVVWRDVQNPDGTMPDGTGVSYKCFSINGFEDQIPIFEDGFESGDTTSWSDTVP